MAAGLPPHLGLYCDEYELTMAQSFWLHQQDTPVAFELFVRTLPGNRGYLVAGGIEAALAYLADFHFDDDDLSWLGGLGYDPSFLSHLADVRFQGDVEGVREGTVVGASTPLLRVVAPRLQATLVETALLAIVNHETLIATKARRVVDAAQGRPVWDFSMRRLHGLGAALGVARACYIAGCAGTATVVAGRLLGIPITGTMAHHYVMAFGEDGEQAAFEQFLRDFPRRGVMLVDTYDTQRGVARAIAAARATGTTLAGVRIDSGDLLAESRAARAQLDAAGMSGAAIIASGDLDEYRIAHLTAAGAPISAFGVGTMMGVSADAPALGGIYKMVAQQSADGTWLGVSKRSRDKATDAGQHQVFRREDGDVLALDNETLPGRPLLEPLMRSGEACVDDTLDERRRRCEAEVGRLPAAVRRFEDPGIWPVRPSETILALRRQQRSPAPVEE